jgi:hypothetical protein
MTPTSPQPPKKRLSFGKGLLLMMAVCTTYALLIPEDVLTRFPVLTGFTSFMENLFPAIGSFAKFSPVPEVVRLYYSTMWAVLPVALFWFVKCVQVQERPVSKNLTRLKAIFFMGVFVIFAFLLFYLMAFHVSPTTAVVKPLATGGRSNALVAGLTSNPISIGIASSLMLSAIFSFLMAIAVFLNFIFKGQKHV